jgi:isopentenyl-diphosphate delta-isomerase
VRLVLAQDVSFRHKTTGLEDLDFVHDALPELDFDEIDPSTRFLGKPLALPLMVSCMTGGYAGALAINRGLAEVCAAERIALGVGSQRQALEDRRYHRTFSIVREIAPDIPIVGNIGAAEVARLSSAAGVRTLADLIGADAMAVHLNPLQELLQPEGSPAFRGVLRGIGLLVRELPVPVIVKEIGAGLSADVIRRLLDAGVRHIDVAGAGGTSWARVELLRTRRRPADTLFRDWGIPTVHALREAAAYHTDATPLSIIASGGLVSGLDAAKCLALGADLTAAARPFLQALDAGGPRALRRLLADWSRALRATMFLTGSRTLKDLRRARLVRYDGSVSTTV